MAIKKKGIIAKPGEYRFGDMVEYKTAEELKKAVERQPIITLTLGHPAGGTVRVSDYIGTVTQKWNEERQRVDGEFWFYDEYLPEDVKTKIVNDSPVSLSAGYTVDSVEEGRQRGILYSHIAILKDGEDPKCPLGQCGVNVRMESNSEYRYEQASELSDSAPAPEIKEKEEPNAEAPSVGFNEVQLGQIRDLLSELMPAPPQAEPEPVVNEAEPTPPPEPITEEPRVEPEKVIPAERAKEKGIGEPDTLGYQFLGEEIK